MVRAGGIVTGVIVLLLLVDSIGKLMELPPVVDGTARLGYPVNVVLGIGIIELVCLAVYTLPRTSILGAILLTGYLGGAAATHVRVGDPVFTHSFFPVYIGVLVWGGVFLRDERLRALIPVRSRQGRGRSARAPGQLRTIMD